MGASEAGGVALAEESPGALRRHGNLAGCVEFSGAISQVLHQAGSGVAAFGLAEGSRRAVSLVMRMASEIARGAVTLFRERNWYGGAALVRQLVEVEYLVFLFTSDPNEPDRWLRASPSELRRQYRPAAMRARSGGRFKDAEYWTHCEVGRHPHWKAAALLPERIDSLRLASGELFWV